MSLEVEPKVLAISLHSLINSASGFEVIHHTSPKKVKEEFPILVRANAKSALQTLKADGFTIAVVTETYQEYAEQALELAELREEIDHLVDKHDHRDRSFTSYPLLAERMGLSNDQLVRRMITVSKWSSDCPRENPGLVFIKDNERGMSGNLLYGEDTFALVKVIKALDKRGQGNFSLGFDKLYNSSRRVMNPDYPTWRIGKVQNVTFNMNYEDETDYVNNKVSRVPTIWWVRNLKGDLTPTQVTPDFAKLDL
jgi:hypothetical protein